MKQIIWTKGVVPGAFRGSWILTSGEQGSASRGTATPMEMDLEKNVPA